MKPSVVARGHALNTGQPGDGGYCTAAEGVEDLRFSITLTHFIKHDLILAYVYRRLRFGHWSFGQALGHLTPHALPVALVFHFNQHTTEYADLPIAPVIAAW
jgi:hypothetical protein